MNRRQSLRFVLGALFTAAVSKTAFAQLSPTSSAPAKRVSARLVNELTRLLALAKSGELTSLDALVFTQDGGIDQWGEYGRPEDLKRAPQELEFMKQGALNMLAEAKTQHKDS